VRTAVILACALLAGTALAQPAAPKPDALTPDGARYYGPLRNGKLHGEGKLAWANGTVYEGGLADGLMSGQGKVRWANGQTYEGEFRDGMMDGRGRMTTPDGAVYEGEFKRSFFNGHGEIVYPDGRKYRGDFVLGSFQGKGHYEAPNGARYEGEFLNWRMHGKGRFTEHYLHAHLEVQGATGTLRQPIIHYSFRSMESVLEKLNRYSTASARDMTASHRRGSLGRAVLHGLWAFFRTYVLRLGFLDGRWGFMLAVSNAEGTYYRYVKLWLLQRQGVADGTP